MKFTTQNIFRGSQQNWQFPRPLCWDRVGAGKAKYDVAELFCGLDIETTTITTPQNNHLAFAYHFQFSIGTPRVLNIYLFRKWEHVLDFIDAVADFYQLDEKHHILCGVANLGFEFQFFRKRLEWDSGEYDFFAKEKYKPLKATYRGIEFREILSITGGSLADLARDYCTTQKLVSIDENGRKVSELDYKKLRNSRTPLTKTEELYTINDVVIVSEFMWFLFNEYIRPEHYIPMTFTSILHRELKQELRDNCKKRDERLGLGRGDSYDEWLAFVRSLQPTETQYRTYFDWLFRGGYVHGEALHTGVDGLLSLMFDITSSYPTRISLDYAPMSPFRPCEFSEDKVYTKCLIIHAQFDFIRATTTHTLESRNKIPFFSGAEWDNGRLIRADMIEVYLTEKDYQLYKMYYKWQGMTILECYEAKRGPFPHYVQSVLHKYYKTKEHLKRTGQKESTVYQIAKARCNSVYGDLVKRLRWIKTTYSNDEEWHNDPTPFDYEKEMLKAILSPFWGIWVTAGARFEVCSMIYKLSKVTDVYYCDTDSIKFRPNHKARQIFKHYNSSIKKHRHNRNLRSDLFEGLGEFDPECKGEVVNFKMLGAKRYLYIWRGKAYATVAGMPKAAIVEVGDTPEEILSKFNLVGFHLKPEASGKLTTSYTDEPYSYEVDGEIMTELSGVALYEIPFTLGVAAEYSAYVQRLQNYDEREEKFI